MIEEQIRSNRKFTVEDMERIQKDEVSIVAEAVLPTILKLANTAAQRTNVFHRLSQWDYTMRRDSFDPALFQILLTRLMTALVSDEIQSPALLQSLLDSPAYLDFVVLMFGKKSGESERARWCDNVMNGNHVETCSDLVSSLLLSLSSEKVYPWGYYHSVELSHFPFSNSTFLRPFVHQAVPVGGSQDTVHAQDFSRRADLGFAATSGPNMRLITDMSGSGKWAIETVANR